VIIVLLIRGCGDDDESANPLTSTVPTTGAAGAAPLSQQDFVEQGDTVCLQTNTSLAALDGDDAAQDATDRAELLAGELDSLQSLTLASGEKGENKLQNFYAALADQVEGYRDLVTATERGDETAIAEITTSIDAAAADAQSAAENFGFDACGDTSQVSESSGGGGGGTDETGGTEVPAAPTDTTSVAPTTETPVTPPADGGGTAPAPPADDGDTGGSSSSSGGLTP
jgi:hypothetical protein